MADPRKSTLPPLRSLEEPLYVIPERKDPSPTRTKPGAAARTVQRKRAGRPVKKRQ